MGDGRGREVCSGFWCEAQIHQCWSGGALVKWAIGPDDRGGPWAFRTPHGSVGVGVGSVLGSGVKPKFASTTPGALWSGGPSALMTVEAPEPIGPLRAQWA